MQDVDRFSPAWWVADVPDTAIIPLRKLETIVPYLRQVGSFSYTTATNALSALMSRCAAACGCRCQTSG